MKVLVTGGAGFIGSNLVKYIERQDESAEVTVLDDLSTGSRDNLTNTRARLIIGSILNYDELLKAAEDADSIIHLAAIPSVPRSIASPRPSHDANATGTLNVLEAAREAPVDHVVVASSSSVYGANQALPKNEREWTRPMSPYAVSKHATEGYAIAYNYSYGLSTLAFRFFNVYGPGQAAGHAYAAVIPQFLDGALKQQTINVHGDGEQSRDFTFVETVCKVIYDAVVRKVSSKEPVNLAFGTNTTLNELLNLIENELNATLSVANQSPRPGDVRASQADGALLKSLFPSIEPTELKTGLRQTVSWFQERG